MNKSELKLKLDKNDVDSDAYCLTGGHPSEKYILSQDGFKWAVYYSERGKRVEERRFDSEDEACCYILKIILEDLTTRKNKNN